MVKPTRNARRNAVREPEAARKRAHDVTPQRSRTLDAMVRDHHYIVLGALIAINLLIAFLTFMPQPDTGGDSANYMTLARSLLQHRTYTDLYDPIQPPHTKYPPVFPLVMALAMALGLKSWVQLKVVMALMGTAGVALTFLWIRRRGRPGLAAGIGLLLALSPGVHEQSHWLLSDIPFWMFTMLALLAFDRLHKSDHTPMAVAVCATALAYFTRSAGLPLAIASVLWLAWRRRWRQLAAFVVVLAPLAFLWWLRAQHTGGVAYTREFWLVDPYMPDLGTIGITQLLQRMGQNAVKYATVHIPILLAGRTGSVLTLMTLLMTGFGVYGWWVRLRKRAMVAELLMPFYIGLLFVWPAVWSGERFVMPVFPLLLYYGATGVSRVLHRMTARAGTAATSGGVLSLASGAAIIVVLLLAGAPALTAGIANGRACTNAYMRGEQYPCLLPPEQNYFEAAIWSARELPSNAVVLSRKPRLFYEISHGIRGTTYPMSREPAVFFALADSVKARYVVYDQLTSLSGYYLAPVLLTRPQAFCALQTFGQDGTIAFGIMPGAAAMTDRPVPEGQSPDFVPCDRSYYR